MDGNCRNAISYSWTFGMSPKHATSRPHCGNMSLFLSTCRQSLNTSGTPRIQLGLHIRRGVSKNRGGGVTHGYTRDFLTYLLEYCCVYLVHPKFDFYTFSNKTRQNSLLAVSVKWISVNVNMFAMCYLSQIRHSHRYCIAASCLGLLGLHPLSLYTSYMLAGVAYKPEWL